MSPKQFCEELNGFASFCEQPPTEQQWCVIKRQLAAAINEQIPVNDEAFMEVMSKMSENALWAINLTHKP